MVLAMHTRMLQERGFSNPATDDELKKEPPMLRIEKESDGHTTTAQSDLERYKPLLQTNDVSKFQFDAVDATARVAQNDLAAAEQQLAAAQQNIEIARATVNSSKAKMARSQSLLLESKAQEQRVPITKSTYKSAQAAVERAKAVWDQARLNLGYTTIKAPQPEALRRAFTEMVKQKVPCKARPSLEGVLNVLYSCGIGHRRTRCCLLR
jgi:multidrug resistance efflux pump